MKDKGLIIAVEIGIRVSLTARVAFFNQPKIQLLLIQVLEIIMIHKSVYYKPRVPMSLQPC